MEQHVDSAVFQYSQSLKARSQAVKIRIGSNVLPIAMVLDMDALIDDVIALEEKKSEVKACPYGATLWPSTRAFADFAEAAARDKKIDFTAIQNGLELGCGVGVGACLLANLGAQKVLASDAEEHLEFLVHRNAETFKVENKISFATLDWGKELPLEFRAKFDFVLACDVLYEPMHIKFLPKIASEVVTHDGVFYLADPKRFCYLSALEELDRYFESVVVTSIRVENESADMSQGVVNKNVDFTQVEVLECRRPRKI